MFVGFPTLSVKLLFLALGAFKNVFEIVFNLGFNAD